jgi:hypothetical protein
MTVSRESEAKTERLNILISQDGLRAWVHQPHAGRPGYCPPDAEAILRAVEAAEIAVDEPVRTRVEQLASLGAAHDRDAATAGPPEIPEKFLVAEGTAPVEARNASFRWNEEFAPRRAPLTYQTTVNHCSLNLIRSFEAGVVIGWIKPAVDGVPGRDVFGKPLLPQRLHGTNIDIGPGLRLGADGRSVITECPGRVLDKGGKLRLEEVLEILGDVSLESGNVDVCVDVAVHGTIRSNFHVHTTKSLTVDKAIESANVSAAGDIVVRGGLCGGEIRSASLGNILAGGRITARFCDEMTVRAAGDVCIDKEVLNSQIRTSARLISPRGTILGGSVWAREQIEVSVLGSDVGVKTRVAVGTHPDVLRRSRELEKEIRDRMRSVITIRERIQPLLANLERLGPQQREMAGERLARADQLELAAQSLKAEHDQLLEQARPLGVPQMHVHRTIHAGVRLAISGRETRIERGLPGPLTIELRKIDGATEVVAVNRQTGSVTVLPSTEIDLETWPADPFEPGEREYGRQESERDDPPA